MLNSLSLKRIRKAFLYPFPSKGNNMYIFYNIMLSLQNFLIYAAAFYGNLGNYKSFGDTKFVPDLPKVFLFLYRHTCMSGFMKTVSKKGTPWYWYKSKSR